MNRPPLVPFVSPPFPIHIEGIGGAVVIYIVPSIWEVKLKATGFCALDYFFFVELVCSENVHDNGLEINRSLFTPEFGYYSLTDKSALLSGI